MSLYAGLSLREVYEKRCRHFGVPANSLMLKTLPDTPDDFLSLTRIDLSANFVGYKGFLPLVEVIRCCKSLVSLNLSGQQLDTAALDILCAALRYHPSIRILNLSSNPITIAGGAVLLELFKTNVNIVSVSLDNTMIKDTMMEMIARQLRQNDEMAKGKPQQQGFFPRSRRSTEAAGVGGGAPLGDPLTASPSVRRPTDEETMAVLRRVPSTAHEMLFDENPLPVVEEWLASKWMRFYDPHFPIEENGASARQGRRDLTEGELHSPCAAQRRTTTRYGISSWMRVSELFPNASLFSPSQASTSDEASADASPPSASWEALGDAVPLPMHAQAGFSWLLACVNAVVDQVDDPRGERTLRSLIIAPDGTHRKGAGVFAVRLFIDGAWRYVLVDDFLPVDRYGELLFAKPIFGPGAMKTAAPQTSVKSLSGATQGSVKIDVYSEDVAFWPCILEKAMAKVYGGYEHLDITRAEAAAAVERSAAGATRVPPCARTMADFTGGVGFVRSLSPAAEEAHLRDEETANWVALVELLAASPNAAPSAGACTRAIAISKTEHEMMTSGCVPNFRKEFTGIALDHTPYEVLQVAHVNGFRLVRLRSRLSSVTWRGEWCEQSVMWRQHPDVDRAARGEDHFQRSLRAAAVAKKAAAAYPSGVSPSSPTPQPFWMSYLDFLAYFSEVHVCRIFASAGAETTTAATPDAVWRERLLRSQWTGRPACLGHCQEWYRNPHFRLLMHRRGAVFINVSVKDPRFAQKPRGSGDAAEGRIAFHLLQASRYPIRPAEPYVDPANPSAPLSESGVRSTCLFGTRYADTDSLTFEGVLEETDEELPFWIVPSRDCGLNKTVDGAVAAADHGVELGHAGAAATPLSFSVRIFSAAPFQISEEQLASHWHEAVVDADVPASGEFMSGEDNPQVALQLASSVVTASPPKNDEDSAHRRSLSSSIVKRHSSGCHRASRSSVHGGRESTNRTTGYWPRKEYFSGTILVRASLTALHEDEDVAEGSSTAGHASLEASHPAPASPRAPSQRALALFVTDGETSHTGAPSRIVGPLESRDLVARSLYLVGDVVYVEMPDTVTEGDVFNLLCCVQPTGTRVNVRFRIWSTLPIREAKLLPPWPTQELIVSWSRETGSGVFYEVSGNPQVEVYPVPAKDTFVIRMRMIQPVADENYPTTIMLTVVANSNRCGEGLLGRIPTERILARSEYVSEEWVQCEVEIGDVGMDSLLIIPCLQPARSQGTCLISVASESSKFSIREVGAGFM